MLSCITLQVRSISLIGCVAWTNNANTVCRRLQTDASVPWDRCAWVQSPASHQLFFSAVSENTFSHTNTHSHTSLSPNHWSQIGAKYRRWGRDIGSCQMRPHNQPLTVRLLCSSIMTSRCTCLSARPAPHTGTQVRLNIAPLPLCLPPLHHSAPHPSSPPHTHPSFQSLIWSKLGSVARQSLNTYTIPLSSRPLL